MNPSLAIADALWAAARSGDEAAWTELVRRYEHVIRCATRAYSLPPVDADDVVQSTWLALLANMSQMREPAALPGWLATTARRECMRLRTAQLRTEPVDPARMPDQPLPHGPEDEVIAQERHEALRTALASLPPDRRALLDLLLNAKEPSYDEIARTLGVPRGSIGPTRARSLRQLRAHDAIRRLSSTA